MLLFRLSVAGSGSTPISSEMVRAFWNRSTQNNSEKNRSAGGMNSGTNSKTNTGTICGMNATNNPFSQVAPLCLRFRSVVFI
jgi:hypothetical protein